jgi:hypothetical protein
MEKSVLAALAAGLIALFLYLSFSQTHDAQRATFNAKQERDAAEFDRDFAAAGGKSKEEIAKLDARAVEAQKSLDAAKRAESAVQQSEGAKRIELQTATEADIKAKGGPDLTAAGKKISDQLRK